MSARKRGQNPPNSGQLPAETRQGWPEEVAGSAAADSGGLDPGLLGDFLDRLATAGPEHSWDRHANATFAAHGAHAAERGVSLRSLVDLYLSAAWRAWPRLPNVTGQQAAATIRDTGQRVLRLCDDAVAALAEGYTDAGRGLLRREESARREFVDDLLAGTADPALLLSRAQAYGLRLAGNHRVLLIETRSPVHEGSPLLAEVGAALADAQHSREELITTRDGRLVVVLPALTAPQREAMLRAVRRVLATHDDPAQPAALALGREHPGPSGVARSFTEAHEALALAATLQLPDTVVRADDLLVYQVLLRDRAALTDLIDTVLAPLRQARGGAAPLLDTLAAYLDSGGNTTRTADLLHLSVRAVSYRLDRVAALTGMHPGDPRHRYTLHTAVLGARALGWPASR